MLKLLKAFGGGALAIALLLALTTWWPRPGAVAAAATEREVELTLARKVDPVLITQVTLGNAVVQTPRFGPTDPVRPFQGDDDWIQNLSLYLLNRTNQTVVFADVDLVFPETGDGFSSPQDVVNLNLGRIPDAVALDGSGRPHLQPPDWQPLSFGPGQTMVIHLSDHIDRIAAGASPGLPLASAKRLKIVLSAFYFPNGMKFAANSYSTPDPEKVGRWVHKPVTYFLGDPSRNWPGPPVVVGGKEMR
jgi:hypothetical protein